MTTLSHFFYPHPTDCTPGFAHAAEGSPRHASRFYSKYPLGTLEATGNADRAGRVATTEDTFNNTSVV
jgi:hypothetical protein